jgi:hypothetical protein
MVVWIDIDFSACSPGSRYPCSENAVAYRSGQGPSVKKVETGAWIRSPGLKEEPQIELF